MASLIFWLVGALILGLIILMFIYRRRQTKKQATRKRLSIGDIGTPAPYFSDIDKVVGEKLEFNAVVKESPYASDLIVLRINGFSGKPYMGYELHQALLSAGLRFGGMGLFHRYEYGDRGDILFSLAAATLSGSFVIEKIGSFKCNSLLLFMHLEPKKKLMTSFDLMLDTARQLIEELGGEIYDDLQQLINAGVIKRLREKICAVETSNLYVSDLLDNLD